MVPDGTSISVLSLARWYQFYEDSSQTRLAIDPHICGIVKNHSSNAPIGDSAPTMSWYMTGYPSQTKFTSMYPLQSENDLVRVDAALTYSPRMTVMEAARITLNKAIGLVFTCEFPHATPAATSSHWYNRNDYQTIIQQMIHNSIDVLIGGGAKLLTSQDSMTLVNNGYQVYKNEIKQFEKANNKKMWALFGNEGTSGYLANDWDRNPAKEPSLAQMTQKAIELLSTNKEKEGFFLMVEGSKIDWASHNNDPVGILSEILAFDAAVKVVIEFAQKNGETLVVICPDHGNGGVSIGNRRSNRGYDQLSLREILEPLKKSKEKKILQRKQYVGFTTTGHTGEDLFLAIYDPRPNKRLSGLVTPDIINRYLCDAMGVKLLDSLTNKYYCKSTELFNEERYFIQSSNQLLKITPRDRPNTTLTIVANSNMVVLNEEKFQTQTPAIYVDKNKTWYISEECFQLLQ
jgi:alkaline phosphatase